MNSTGVAKAPTRGPPRGSSYTDRAWLVWVGFVRTGFRIGNKAFWQTVSVGAHRSANAALSLGGSGFDRLSRLVFWLAGASSVLALE